MLAEVSDTAPGRSRLSTSEGSTDENVGAANAWPAPMTSTSPTIMAFDGSGALTAQASRKVKNACWTEMMISIFLRSYLSANEPPISETKSRGPSWANPTRPARPGPLMWVANAMSTTFCIHVPTLDAMEPAKTRRKPE
jgi:hypothetical protein